MIVNLGTEEVGTALMTGYGRWSESVRKGRKDSVSEKPWVDGLLVHVYGAIGEIAVAKALDIYAPLRINQFANGAPDLPPDIEVRHRIKDDFDLIIREENEDAKRYILTTGTPPAIAIRGWIRGSDGKKEEYLRSYGGFRESYFVPQSALNPMETFKR